MSVTAPPLSAAEQRAANQPPPFEDVNYFALDAPLREALAREGGAPDTARALELGALVGSAEAQEHRRRAQRNIPLLRTHDRYGNRLDTVEYDPSFHWLLRQGIERGLHSLPWRSPAPGAHVERAALFHLFNQLDTGPCCPLAVNYAAVPTLRQEPALAAAWEERATSLDYEAYAQLGMAMTEKQGGSDLRANTTRAVPAGDGSYAITGHKWFCTIVICDAFFLTAQAPGGLSCFLLEKGPGFRVQRLKDKLGGRSLASSEVEFDGARAWLIGEEGRGVPAIATQVNYTRLDTILGTAGMMRRLLAEAVHHARHRTAFGRLLAEQPLMLNVLADLALESEAATAAALRVARSYDGEDELPFRRFATAVTKYWVCKRGAPFAVEALECLGGNGYVEEAPMAQFYRDIEIGTVWEGSGNVAALDVVRIVGRDPAGCAAFVAECERARGGNARLDAHLDRVAAALAGLERSGEVQWGTRRLVEDLALALQASLLVRHAPPAVADAFCAGRLGERLPRVFGTLPAGVAATQIVDRALPTHGGSR